jgi:hypothetical protein
MSNMKRKLQKTEHGTLNAKDGRRSSVLQLEILHLRATFAKFSEDALCTLRSTDN